MGRLKNVQISRQTANPPPQKVLSDEAFRPQVLAASRSAMEHAQREVGG